MKVLKGKIVLVPVRNVRGYNRALVDRVTGAVAAGITPEGMFETGAFCFKLDAEGLKQFERWLTTGDCEPFGSVAGQEVKGGPAH